MCGRYVLARDTEDLVREFDVDQVTWSDPPPAGYNVAPTTTVPIVVDRHDEDGQRSRQLGACAWGLVPSWARDTSGAAKLINARVETVAEKPTFRTAFARRRCLVPADGWFEWAREESGPGRQPYYVTPQDGSMFAFAGLYEMWSKGEERLLTCTIITTAAVGPLQDIHHRMPLMLPPDAWSTWLDRRVAAPTPVLPTPASVAALELRPVGPAVGNIRNRGPELLTPVTPLLAATEQQALDLH